MLDRTFPHFVLQVGPAAQPVAALRRERHAKPADGAASADIPVRNGIARVKMPGVHPGK